MGPIEDVGVLDAPWESLIHELGDLRVSKTSGTNMGPKQEASCPNDTPNKDPRNLCKQSFCGPLSLLRDQPCLGNKHKTMQVQGSSPLRVQVPVQRGLWFSTHGRYIFVMAWAKYSLFEYLDPRERCIYESWAVCWMEH